jgi:hypothetical protein
MKKIKPFNLYYLNLSKVYEISMMINNVILTGISSEEEIGKSKESSLSVNYESEVGNKDLAKIKSSLSSGEIEKQTYSSKISRTFEVKTTKSRLLLDIIKKCETVKKFDTNTDTGVLIKVDDLKLNLFNEEETRAILALRKNALEGFQHEGLNVNNFINAVIQDYTFVIRGELKNEKNEKQNLIFRIPTSLESEFENQYTIDDLLIGKVSVIGIYRGEETKKSIESNTITFFQNVGTESNQSNIVSGNEEHAQTNEPDETKYHYVDILAITQDIRFHLELNRWQKLLKFTKRLWKRN